MAPVIPVPAKSTEKIIAATEKFLSRFQPIRLRQPGVLDFGRLVEAELPSRKIDVYPADPDELGGDEGLTRLSPDPSRVEILIREVYFDALFQGSKYTHRARTTLVHEIGHSVLHARTLKKLSKVITGWGNGLVLHRESNVPPYRDPEWQAWAFAGALLFPCNVLRRMSGRRLESIAEEFGTSVSMLKSHLKKLRRKGFCVHEGVLLVRS